MPDDGRGTPQERLRFYAPIGISGLTRGDAWVDVDLSDPEHPVAVTHLHGPEAIELVRSHLKVLDCRTRVCTSCSWLKPCAPHRRHQPLLQIVR